MSMQQIVNGLDAMERFIETRLPDDYWGLMAVLEKQDGSVLTRARGLVHPGAVRYVSAGVSGTDVQLGFYGLPLRKLGDPAELLRQSGKQRPDRFLCFGIDHRVEARASRVRSEHSLLHGRRGKISSGARVIVERQGPGLAHLSGCTLCPNLDMFQGQSLWVSAADCTVADTASLLRRMAEGRIPAPGHWLAEESMGESWYWDEPVPGTVESIKAGELVIRVADDEAYALSFKDGMRVPFKPGETVMPGQQLYSLRRRRLPESAVAHSHDVLSHLEGVVFQDGARGEMISVAAVEQLRYRCTHCLSDGGLRVPNSVGPCQCGGTMVPAPVAWWDCRRVGTRLAVPRGTHHEEVLLPENFPQVRRWAQASVKEDLPMVATA